MATSITSFTPDIAKAVAEISMQSLEFESPVTRKVIEAITNPEYRPDPKSRTALELAWHIVYVEVGFVDETANLKFTMTEEPKPPASVAEILAYYEENLPKAIAKIRAMTGDQLLTPVDFYGVWNQSAFRYLEFAVKHSVHHRGFLASYLRPMGSKIPGIYGGSADEPWQGQ